MQGLDLQHTATHHKMHVVSGLRTLHTHCAVYVHMVSNC